MTDHTARLIGIGYDEDDFLYKPEEGTMWLIWDYSGIIIKIADSV